jgi:hypothetical protein
MYSNHYTAMQIYQKIPLTSHHIQISIYQSNEKLD